MGNGGWVYGWRTISKMIIIVRHEEMYVPDVIVKEYKSVDEVVERYSLYADTVRDFVEGLGIGETVSFMYDHYIDLTITRKS